MLKIYHSNRLEALADSLIALLDEPGAASVLGPELVVTQHQGMARWLNLRIAASCGIATNIEYPFPASFVWQVFRSQFADLPDQSVFERGVLAWRCLSVLPPLLVRRSFEDLRQYLEGDAEGYRAYQLAGQIADMYDQYLVYRPEWLLRWEEGGDGHWQAQLWRALCAGAAPRHRARLLQAFVELAGRDRLRFDHLPGRVMVFGVSSLPPAYLEVLARLAAGMEVHLFVLNPCLSFWGDIVDGRDLARLRALWRRHGKADVSEHYTVGNRLLASLGKQGRDFQQLLHQYPCEDVDLFQAPDEGALLGSLQSDILQLTGRGGQGQAPRAVIGDSDRSLEVHVCHSPMREVQVLHDCLLERLERDAGLTPRDIVVMVPEIDRYAPYIEAVFGSAPAERYIPWSVADRSARSEHVIIEALFMVLALPAGRMAATEVLDILEVPAVMRRFSLDARDMELLRRWVRESGIHWGRDAQERTRHGLPPGDDNTWEFGLRRMMLGYAMSPGSGLYRDVLPLAEVGGPGARALGQLHSFIERLTALRRLLKSSHAPEVWRGIFNDLLDLFDCADDDERQALQRVRDAMDLFGEQTAQAGFVQPLPLEVVKDWLQRHLEQAGGAQRFLAGQVSFCALLPMRSIPFRVVCLLGMNHADFPRQRKAPGFDLMRGEEARLGDRSRREDDRYLFLEALLSAREALHISYTGRSLRDNGVLLPSVLVSELLDAVSDGYAGENGPICEQVVIEHPLQPYSGRQFSGHDRLFSYAAEWFAARAPGGRVEPFIAAPLAAPDAELKQVDLDDLLRFYRNPARFFLNKRLGVYLDEDDDVIEDSERFALDGLQRFHFGQELLDRQLKGEEGAVMYPLWRAAGALPFGAFGTLVFDDVAAQAGRLAQAVRPHLPGARRALEIDLALGDFTLRGWLRDASAQGVVRYRYGRLRPEDQLRLWLEHLMLQCAGAAPACESRYIAMDGGVRYTAADEPRILLQEYLDAYWQGLHEPLPLFPKSSLAYAERCADGDEYAAMQAARKAWTGGFGSEGEGGDPYLSLAFRGRDPFAEGFAPLARRLLLPMCLHCETSSPEQA